MNLNSEQIVAVEQNDKSISLSAGAGSGKTRVLVEKFWRIIEMGNDINSILAITFTRKAAQEMIERIRNRVDESDLDPKQKRIIKESLSTAWIGTIDSICTRIIKEYPIEAEIDPGFIVVDDMTINELCREAARKVLLEAISSKELSVLKYIEMFGYKRTIEDMQNLYTLLVNKGLQLDLIRKLTLDSLDNATRSLPEIVEEISRIYDELIEFLPVLGKKTQTYSNLCEIAANKSEWLQALSNIASLNYTDYDWEQVVYFGSLCKKLVTKDIKSLADSLKDLLEKLQCLTIDINTRPYLETLFELTRIMQDKVLKIKSRENVLEYSDLEDKAISLLNKNNEIRTYFQEQFKHIMVDEFQDTNYRQVELIKILSNDFKNNVFIVGDAKQSIYRFRGAQVELFAKVTERIEAQKGLSHNLSNNFRTVKPLINFINNIFDALMKDGNLKFESLVAKREVEVKNYAEIHLLCEDNESDLDTDEAEAYCIARRITELILNKEKLVFDVLEGREVARPVKYSDIAILFQKKKTMEIFAAIMSEYNIPYFVLGSHGFFITEEVNAVIQGLKAANNPLDDMALIGWLRSSMLGVSDEALWYIRQQYDSFYSGIKELDKITEFLKTADYNALLLGREIIDYLFMNKDRLSLKEVIKYIIEHTAYDSFLALQPNGEQKLANLNKLIQIAQKKSAETYSDLDEFLEYVIRAKQSFSADEQQASVNSEASDTVKLMTIHQSKGLEFPIVIIPHLQQKFNTLDTRDRVVFSDDLGVFLRTEPKGYLRNQAEANELKLIIEEYKRLFYVAQTRARDYLILSGCYKQKKEKNSEIVVPKANNDSWLDWIFNYLGVGEDPLNVYFENNRINAYLYNESDILRIKNEELYLDESQLLKKRELYKYAFYYSDENIRRNFISATQLMEYSYCPFYAYLTYKQGLPIRTLEETQSDKTLTASSVGTIIHKIIETTDNLEEAYILLGTLVKELEDDKVNIMKEMLKQYYENEFIKELHNNNKLLKEVPFIVRLEDNLYLNGYVDQLWLGEHDYHIADLKTGMGYEKEEHESYNLQLNFYQIALDKIIKRKLEKKMIFYLRNGEIRSVPDKEVDFYMNSNPRPKRTEKCNFCVYRLICFPSETKEV